jgi:hypothetical protein
MLNLRTIEVFISVLTIAIAYTVSTTVAGYLQAWVAKKVGDNSPAQSGFLTLNPFVHIDPIGAVCLFLVGIGWGKFVPLNPSAVHGAFNMILLFTAQPLSYMFIAFIALLSLLAIFGIEVLQVAMMMVLSEYISLGMLAKLYPHSSSLVLAIALILIMFIYIGVMFAVLNFILNGFRYALLTILKHFSQQPENDFLVFFIPFVLMVLFARPLKLFVVYAISYSAGYIAYAVALLSGVS